jgi:predicted CXXCH cytochrome family protein
MVVVVSAGAPPGDEVTPCRSASSSGCANCHHFDRGLTHPVDVTPSMRVPDWLPLTAGRMTCITCHDLETPLGTTAPARLRGDTTSGAAARMLCLACHDPQRGRPSDLHALATPAHLGSSHDELRAFGAGRPPDTESESCLACHDGALAPDVPVRTSRGAPSFARLMGGQHPIGVEQRPRSTGDTLRRPEEIDPAIRLFDGRVGCGSCHSPYAEHEDLLVMSNHRSRLCLQCHDF